MHCLRSKLKLILLGLIWPIAFHVAIAANSVMHDPTANATTRNENQDRWQVGVAKRDITPTEPVRLSGYAVRNQPYRSIADPLTVRAMAMRHGSRPWSVLVSVDCIGLSAELTDRMLRVVKDRHGIERSQIVFCCTHSHSTPHLTGALTNLFTEELSPEEQLAVDRYSDLLVSRSLEAIDEALVKHEPATIDLGEGKAGFAINRRALKNGNWTGFGTEAEGPVDRTVRILRVLNDRGQPLAVAYQYACHCTSISPEVNQVSADWAGLSASQIEKELAGCIALPIVGCGADANPNPRGSYEHAQLHGQELATSVLTAIQMPMTTLPPLEHTAFSYVALAYERPSEEQLQAMEKSDQNQQRRFAASMRAVVSRMGRIPETYPAPLHLWRFGDTLHWVFMGGEVVVDYQIRMPTTFPDSKHTWVAGYADDVFAYVASERVRREGGYEVDGSMLYYNRPGRWESGTEELIVGRIQELDKQMRDPAVPLSPAEAFAALQVAEGYRVEQVACEPLVCDPVNIAFDCRGRAWIVEMGDYPEGGGHGGRIRILEDTDGDGKFDQSKVFLDKLEYPAGVFPWRDGAIIACSPEVFWARDTNGDDRMDEKQVLISGFAMGNPQHRVHGFSYGLDHRLHFGVGMEVRGIKTSSGQTLNVVGTDLSLDVERGEARIEAGPSQFIRSQDDWGNWFGNDNMHPLFQYVLEHRYLEGKQRFTGSTYQQVFHPATAPIVYPIQRDSDRFNDLFTANRFTSACSGIICRSQGVGGSMLGATVVCEPVHNLVSRAEMKRSGSTYRASRFPEDHSSEWLRSSDAWFRPVRVENAPDGTLWVLDMYRRVIEHPEWIPEDWQARIDVRAGEGLGRIYRVFDANQPPSPIPNMQRASTREQFQYLASPQSAVREMAQRQLIFSAEASSKTELIKAMKSSEQPLQRLHAMAVLHARGWLDDDSLESMLADKDPRVARMAVRWSDERTDRDWSQSLAKLAQAPSSFQSSELALQLLLSTSFRGNGKQIGQLLLQNANDEWFMRAARMQKPELVDQYLNELLDKKVDTHSHLEKLLVELLPAATPQLQKRLLDQLKTYDGTRPQWHFVLAAGLRDQQASAIEGDAYQSILKEARELAVKEDVGQSMREAATHMLVSNTDSAHQDEVPLLLQLASQGKIDRLGVMALEGLRRTKSGQVAKQIIEQWSRLGPQSRANLVHHLVTERNWLPELLEAMEQKRLQYSDLDPVAVEHLTRLPDEGLRTRASKILAAGQGDPSALIVEYLGKLPTHGETEKGRALFERQCALCHRDRDEVTAIGPNLTTLKEWTDQAWLTAILDPNRAVEARYRRTLVATDDGSIHVGILVSETEEWIDLALADGQRERVNKSSIENLRESNQSLMPEGFGTFMTPTDLRHLIEYLRSPSFQ